MADDNLALMCEAADAVRVKSELERTRVFRQLKIDMGLIMIAAMSLEKAVNQLEEGTDVTRRCVEALFVT